MATSDLYIRIDGSSAGFDAAASTAGKAALRLEVSLKSAATAQGLLNKAVAEYGAGSAEAIAASKAYEGSLSRVARAEETAALASKRATETMARDNAARVASAEAASVKQAAALKKMGSAYGAVGLAAAAGLALAAKAAADFESKFAQVTSLSRTTSPVDLAKLKAASFGFTDIGVSATSAADAEIELVKAGISVKDQLGGALAGTLNLAAAGQLAVGDAASIAAQALTQFQLSGKDIPHVADLLAAGADKALGSVQDLGDALKYSGLSAHQAGLTIDQTTGILAEFAQAGLIGAQGGTTLQQVLRQIQAPTAKAALEIKALGLNVYDAQGTFVGLSSIAGQLHDKLSGMSDAQRQAALNTLFTSRAVRGATILYQDGSRGVDAWAKKVQASGFAAEQATGKMNSLTGDLQKLKAEVTNAAIAFGEQLQGPLRLVVQDLTGFASLLGGMPGPLKEAAFLTLAFTAAVGAGVFVYSRATTALASLGTTMGIAGAKTAAGRIGFAALGIGLATLNSQISDSHQTVKGFLDIFSGAAAGAAFGPWGAAAGALGGTLQALSGVFDKTHAAVDGFTASLDQSTGALTSNSRAAAAKIIADNDLTKFIDAAGISTQTYSDALLGNEKAIAKVQTATGGLGTFLGKVLLPPLADAKAGADNLAEANFVLATTADNKTSPALAALGNATRSMGGTMLDTAGDVLKAATTQDNAATSADKLATATQRLIDQALKLDQAVLNQRATMRDYQAALDATTASLTTNGKTLDITTQKGRDNAASLDAMASSAIQVANGIKNMGAQTKFITEAHDQLVQQAIAFGMGDKAAEGYANRVLRDVVPALTSAKTHLDDATASAKDLGAQKPTVQVSAETSAALAAMQRFRVDANTALAGINNEYVQIALQAQTSKVLAQLGMATGGPILGGIPGKDSVPILAMPGEHVLTTADVAAMGGHAGVMAMRSMLHSGGLPRFSTGGIVGKDVPLNISTSASGLATAVSGVEALFNGLTARIGDRLSKSIAEKVAQGVAQGITSGLTGPPGVRLGNGLYRPVSGPLTQGLHDQWTGFPAIDIGVPEGTPVHSGAPGRVTSSYDIPGNQSQGYASYGRVIQVLHQGFSTLYAHLSQRGVGVGANLAGGQVLGLSGNTGNSFGPHLHFGAQGISPYAFYDQGGRWPSGTTGINTSGHDETVLPYPPEAIARAMKSAVGYMGGPAPQIVVQAPNGPFKVKFDIGGQTLTGVMESIADDRVAQAASHGRTMASLSS